MLKRIKEYFANRKLKKEADKKALDDAQHAAARDFLNGHREDYKYTKVEESQRPYNEETTDDDDILGDVLSIGASILVDSLLSDDNSSGSGDSDTFSGGGGESGGGGADGDW